MHSFNQTLIQFLTTMQIVKAFKSLVPSIELTNDENRTSHLTGTWTDNQGYRDEHKLSFRYVRNSEKLAALNGKANLKTKDIEYIDEWGNKHVLTAQRSKEIMLLAESVSKQANALSDLYEEAGITPDEILGVNNLIDVQANLA
jgi:hypothetical protein